MHFYVYFFSLLALACGEPRVQEELPPRYDQLGEGDSPKLHIDKTKYWRYITDALGIGDNKAETPEDLIEQLKQPSKLLTERQDDYQEMLKKASYRFENRAYATRCAAITNVRFLFRATERKDHKDVIGPKASVWLIEYKAHTDRSGNPEGGIRHALVVLPDKTDNSAPLFMYGHGSDTGLAYDDIAMAFGEMQSQWIIAAPAFPGEPICRRISFEEGRGVCDRSKGPFITEGVGEGVAWNHDVEDFLVLQNCLVRAIENPNFPAPREFRQKLKASYKKMSEGRGILPTLMKKRFKLAGRDVEFGTLLNEPWTSILGVQYYDLAHLGISLIKGVMDRRHSEKHWMDSGDEEYVDVSERIEKSKLRDLLPRKSVSQFKKFEFLLNLRLQDLRDILQFLRDDEDATALIRIVLQQCLQGYQKHLYRFGGIDWALNRLIKYPAGNDATFAEVLDELAESNQYPENWTAQMMRHQIGDTVGRLTWSQLQNAWYGELSTEELLTLLFSSLKQDIAEESGEHSLDLREFFELFLGAIDRTASAKSSDKLQRFLRGTPHDILGRGRISEMLTSISFQQVYDALHQDLTVVESLSKFLREGPELTRLLSISDVHDVQEVDASLRRLASKPHDGNAWTDLLTKLGWGKLLHLPQNLDTQPVTIAGGCSRGGLVAALAVERSGALMGPIIEHWSPQVQQLRKLNEKANARTRHSSAWGSVVDFIDRLEDVHKTIREIGEYADQSPPPYGEAWGMTPSLFSGLALVAAPASITAGHYRALLLEPLIKGQVMNMSFSGAPGVKSLDLMMRDVLDNDPSDDELDDIALEIFTRDYSLMSPFLFAGLKNWSALYADILSPDTVDEGEQIEDRYNSGISGGSMLVMHGKDDLVVPFAQAQISTNILYQMQHHPVVQLQTRSQTGPNGLNLVFRGFQLSEERKKDFPNPTLQDDHLGETFFASTSYVPEDFFPILQGPDSFQNLIDGTVFATEEGVRRQELVLEWLADLDDKSQNIELRFQTTKAAADAVIAAGDFGHDLEYKVEVDKDGQQKAFFVDVHKDLKKSLEPLEMFHIWLEQYLVAP